MLSLAFGISLNLIIVLYQIKESKNRYNKLNLKNPILEKKSFKKNLDSIQAVGKTMQE